MTEQLDDQTSLFGQDTWSGKMSPARSAAKRAQTLPQSLRKRLGLSAKQNPYLKCLTVGGPGGDASVTLTDDGALLGELWTRSTGENPSSCEEQEILLDWVRRSAGDEFLLSQTSTETLLLRYALVDAKLSQILQEDADPKYRLSRTACEGILRRAERRGKQLPEVLDRALRQAVD